MTQRARTIKQLAKEIHEEAKTKGWWDSERNKGEALMLCVSELSEALEGLREGNPPDKHIPEFDSVSVELADCIIRILDFSEGFGYNVAEALEAKFAFNKTRPHKHGKEF